MSARVAKRPTEEDWLAQKPTLKKYWLDDNKKLLGEHGVMETMRTQHHFSASKSQYENQFKRWGWKKNKKREDWEQLAAVMCERERLGKETDSADVYIDGDFQSRDKVRKEVSRYSQPKRQPPSLAAAMQFPKNITIRTPTWDRTPSLTVDLPFHRLVDYLRLEAHRPGHQIWSGSGFPVGPSMINPRLTLLDTPGDEDLDMDGNLSSIGETETLEQQGPLEARNTTPTTSKNVTTDSAMFAALRSVVPKLLAEKDSPDSSTTSLTTRIFTSPLHRQLLFSLANNFAGLGAFPVHDIISFLRKETSETIYQLVSSARSYSSRAIVLNLFKAAIESGDARIVDVLIRQNPEDIKVNELFLSVAGCKYTPIERASYLGYKDVVENLLNHQANVNGTHSHEAFTRRGALDYAVSFCGSKKGVSKSDTQIVRMLLAEGGNLSVNSLYYLIDSGEKDLVEAAVLFMSVNAGKSASEWSRSGIHLHVAENLDDDTSREIINLMFKNRADINFKTGSSIMPSLESPVLIDVAARRGKLKTVKFLLDSGASLTDSTLPEAVTSGNYDLILLLITRGADLNSISSCGVTPLAAAIILEDAQVLQLLEDRGISVKKQRQKHFVTAVEAASKVGNIQELENLIRLGDEVNPDCLGYALVRAIRNGWDDLTKSLIDAGANTNFDGNGTPLVEALKRRKEAIVLSLLDADASPRYLDAIALAAKWGNRSVMENLILAGADVNKSFKQETALTIAIKKQDHELVHFLLDVGAEMVSFKRPLELKDDPDCCSALVAAAEIGDIDMARFLLDHGADPNNSEALEKAKVKNEKLFDLILERYKLMYPTARGYFGAGVLAEAVVDGNEKIIRLMLERRINANAMINLNGQRASSFGHAIPREQVNFTGCLEMFLQSGCNPNDVVAEAHNSRGYRVRTPPPRVTAFLAAIGTRNISTVELLIRYGADVNLPTRGRVKRTPLQRSAEVGSLDIFELLLNHGANVHAPAAERGGGTALQLAAIGGFIPIACNLLNLKADPNAPKSKVNGRTALEGAAEHGRLDMVQLLLNGGAGSRPGDVASAIAFAKDNGHTPICDLLESHLNPGVQSSGPDLLATDNNGDLNNFNLNDDPFSSFMDLSGVE